MRGSLPDRRHRLYRDALDRALVVLLPAGAGIALCRAALELTAIPFDNWNASRLSAAFVVTRGFDLYAPLDGGPIADFMYGPMAALAYAPVALGSSATAALYGAGVASLLFVLAPIAWLHGTQVRDRLVAGAAFLAFALLVFQHTSLTECATRIHADAPALGLATCAVVLFLQRLRRASQPAAAGLACAACAVLAVWTKQTLAPLLVALPAWLWWREGRAAALRFGLLLAALGVGVSVVFAAWWGPEALYFNMWALPRRVPFTSEYAGSLWGSVTSAARELAREGGWSVGLLATGVAARWPLGAVRSAGTVRGLRFGAPALLLGIALLEVPAALAGRAKLGGAANSLGVTTLFLLAAATVCLTRAAAPREEAAGRAARGLLLAVLALASGLALADVLQPGAMATTVARLRAPADNPVETAVRFAQRHPGQVLFAVTPLVSLIAEDRLYHSFYGVMDRDLAGLRTGDALLRRHLPPRLRWIALPRGRGAPRYLPEFDREVRKGALPGWVLLGRGPAGGHFPQPEPHSP